MATGRPRCYMVRERPASGAAVGGGWRRLAPAMSASPRPLPMPHRSALRRLLPLLLLIAGLLLAFALGLQHYLSFEALCDHRAWLLQLVEHHFILSLLA